MIQYKISSSLPYSILSALLCTLSFAPFHLPWLNVIGLALLLYRMPLDSAKKSFIHFFLFSLVFFGTSVSWVFISLYRYGNLGAAISGLLTVLFIVVLSLIQAPLGFVYTKCLKYPAAHRIQPIVFALLWVLFEYLRSTLFTGFPWVLLGTAHVESLLGEWAPIGGVWLVSASVAWLTASINQCARNKPSLFKILLATPPFFCVFFWHHPWTHPNPDKTQSIAIIQPNIPQQIKWDPLHAEHIVSTLSTLSKPFLHQKTWIIWPESSVPIPLPYSEGWIQQWLHNAQATLILGAPFIYSEERYTNQVWIANTHQRYEKEHLVPFGEYIPFSSMIKRFLHFFDVPLSQFTANLEPRPLIQNNWHIGVAICYEIAYPELVRKRATDADVLLTLSNDGWFGHSLGPYQHLQIAQMRAKETGRMLVRATNTGVSAVVSADGHVVQSLPLNTQGVLETTITAFEGQTPWVRLHW